MAVVNDGGVMVDESDEELQRFIDDPYFIHYTGMLMRPGVSDCVQFLEHTYFKPGTPRNELFHMRVIEWMDLTWIMVSIPIGDKDMMEKTAQVSGLRVSNDIPMVFQGEGVIRFPVVNERVFTLENTPDHQVYQNRHLRDAD